jgi:hypothetical protein
MFFATTFNPAVLVPASRADRHLPLIRVFLDVSDDDRRVGEIDHDVVPFRLAFRFPSRRWSAFTPLPNDDR